MRALLVLLVIAGCDRGPRAEPTAPPPPTPAVAAPPKGPHVIAYQVGGLGSWKGQVNGIMWHVTIDLDKATISITDPGGATKQHALAAGEVTSYATLAKAVSEAPPYKPSNSCTDRSETLQIDNLVLSDSCPIAQRDAAALIAMFDRELQ